MRFTLIDILKIERRVIMTSKTPYGTVLIKASRILDILSSTDKPLTLNQIAVDTELTNSTALKILDTLQLIGYVQKDEDTKRYSLGPAIIKYAYKAINHLEIKHLAEPHLKKLHDITKETIHLGIQSDNHIIYVLKIESTNPIKLYSQIGKSIPLYCSAMGKAILADQTDSQIDSYLQNNKLLKFTENTITSKKAFLNEIRRIREQGYAFDNCEHEEDVFCVGSSISVNGKNFGAFSVSVPKYRLTNQFLEEIINAVLECRNQIISDLQ